ncbi:HhoA/HhoB/HtrA family serine endopeptidase [Planktothrix agardhii]|jgi:S1-C subfamily serine protease|uniref:HhoA/HhoB/HtrA family serine endopeptidase n=1 Tax=Planktothrix agardhii TaxID=1160 RepID=UPI0020A83853|nr:HhoA/HhoB/HtrA family serine endopeptidase [Planktothrix agardhii]CAD5930950.1 Putative serine protease HhoB [Planktothrix agardhii]
MKITSDKENRKSPLWSLFLLIIGGGLALMGDRWLATRTASTVPPSIAETPVETAPAPAANFNGQANSASSPTSWLAQKVAAKPVDSNFIVDAVNEIGPAVVRINASRQAKRRGLEQFGNGFPEEFFGATPPKRRSDGPIEQGTGSGFILSADGVIMTNSHVVEGTERVQVVLKDGRRFDGKVLGSDAVTDVAVIKIDADNLPSVKIGNSEALSPGEWAIAIGNPLGLDNSVTVGIISATGRSSSDIGVPDKRIGFIQTDAAINPGNSGGPLLNAKGEVIGMNTAIISGAQGLGFAIPINKAQQIAQQLATTGRAEHAYLGIEMVTLSPELYQELKENHDLDFPITQDNGVLIMKVIPGSPAMKSGLKPGDIIVKIDEKPMTKSDNVQELVQNKNVGIPMKVELNRQGNPLILEVKTGNMPQEQGIN